MKIKIKIKKILNFLKELYEFINGDQSYKIYVLSHKQNCKKKLLTKNEFLKNKRIDKYKTINRCC